MGIFNAYEAAKRAFQDVVSPDLQFLKGQLQALSAEVCRPNEKIDSKHAEVLSEIRRLDEKIDFAIRFHERLARVEAKLDLSAP